MTVTSPSRSAPSLERARLVVGCGLTARGLVSRFVAALAAQADLPLDRMEEACLVAETIADRCHEVAACGELELAVTVVPGRLDLRVGPLNAGAAGRILGADRGRPGDLIRALATSVSVRPARGGTEVVRVVVTVHEGP